MSESASYSEGYRVGRTNAEGSGQGVIGAHYMPTADERARSVDFKGDDDSRAGWLAGWTDGAAPFRDFQERELGVTSAAGWIARYRRW